MSHLSSHNNDLFSLDIVILHYIYLVVKRVTNYRPH